MSSVQPLKPGSAVGAAGCGVTPEGFFFPPRSHHVFSSPGYHFDLSAATYQPISQRSLTSTTKLCQDRKACFLIWERSYNRTPAPDVLFRCVKHTEEVMPNNAHLPTV